MSIRWMVAASIVCGLSMASAAFGQDNGGGLVSPQDFQSPTQGDGGGLRGPVDQGGGNLSGTPIDANPPHAFTPAPYDNRQSGYQPANSNPANNGPGSLDSTAPNGKKQKHIRQSSSSGGDPGGALGLTDRAAKGSVDVGTGAAKAGVGVGGKAAKEVFKAIF